MDNLLKLLEELDKHDCKENRTVMLLLKTLEKKHWKEIMEYLESVPNATEQELQKWMLKQIYGSGSATNNKNYRF